MSSQDQNLSSKANDLPSCSGKSFGIVVADWNEEITYSMRDACIQTLESVDVSNDDIHVISVPGAFELPLGARLLAGKEKLDAIICIGCVITGETKHDEYISNSVAGAIMQLNVASGKPVIFGVLTPRTKEQALDRAGGKYGNKGVEAATTAIKMVTLADELKTTKKGIGF